MSRPVTAAAGACYNMEPGFAPSRYFYVAKSFMGVQTRQVYEFGPFCLDPARRLLLCDGRVVPLTNKAFETLAVLVQNNGRVVEKDELMKEVWPDTFVEEGSLARNISVLRKTLGEGPSDHQYIQTVPKRGYRFVAEVKEVITASDAAEPVPVDDISLEEVLVGENSVGHSVSSPPEAIAPLSAMQAGADTPGGLDPRAKGATRGEQSGGKRSAALVLAGLAVAFIGLAYAAYRFTGWYAIEMPGHKMTITRFTTTGQSLDAAISPDGKYVVYVSEEAGKQSLWVKQVATGSNVQVVGPADVSYQGLTFSPDGNYIYYNMWDRKSVGAIYQVPVLGGRSVRVIYDVMPALSISPDGKRIAFIRGYAREGRQLLVTANVDGSGEMKFETSADSRLEWVAQPAWSPDGKRIACLAGIIADKEIGYVEVVEFPADGGIEKKISSQQWRGVGGLAWFGDGKGLVLTANDQIQGPLQIWTLSYPDGKAQKITNDVNGYGGVSLTSDSSAMVSVQGQVIANLWIVPDGDTNRAEKITSGRYEGFNFAWTPDNRIVYVSLITGNADIWIMDRDGGNKKQLTSDPSDESGLSVSYDGRHIVYISNRATDSSETGSTPHLWKMDIDGGNQRPLTNGDGEWAPFCSPTGPWLIYLAAATGKQAIYKLPLEGGEPVQLTRKYSYLPAISPDGRFIAYSYWDEDANPPQWGRAIKAIEGEQADKTFSLPSTTVDSNGQVLLRWTSDGRALTYVDNRGGIANIWTLPIDGGAPRQLTNFKDDRIFWFDWSRDGKHLAVGRGVLTNDVVLLNDFK